MTASNRVKTELFTLKLVAMFSFLAPICVTATICLTVYKLFELFVRRKERNMFVEKLSEIPVENLSGFSGRMPFTRVPELERPWSFVALRTGMLLFGIGVGLLVGYFIADINIYTNEDVLLQAQHRTYINMVKESLPVIYGSSVLFFGGLSLVGSFLIEQQVLRQRDKAESQKKNDTIGGEI